MIGNRSMWCMRIPTLVAIVAIGCSSPNGIDPDASIADGGDETTFHLPDDDAAIPLDADFPPPPPRVDFGATVVASPPPPPISGGTLIIARDGHTAIASDPDRDVVWFVDLDTRVVQSVRYATGAEPGRLVEDDANHVFVAL